jgi:hypothetical protein
MRGAGEMAASHDDGMFLACQLLSVWRAEHGEAEDLKRR